MIWPRSRCWHNVCSQNLDTCLSAPQLLTNEAVLGLLSPSRTHVVASSVPTVSSGEANAAAVAAPETAAGVSPVEAERAAPAAKRKAAVMVEACELASAIWTKCGPNALMPAASKSEADRFAKLVCQLGMQDMALQMLKKLQVHTAVLQLVRHISTYSLILSILLVRCPCL